MTFDTTFKQEIIANFNRYKENLLADFKTVFKSALNQPSKVGLFSTLYDLHKGASDLNQEKIASLDLDIYDLSFLRNEICLRISPLPDIPDFNTPEFETFRTDSYAFEKDCETAFWKDIDHVSAFEAMEPFNAYADIILEREALRKYKNRDVFNTEG